MENRIIVDVGANNGDDTDFYLRKGFDVIAIEADPVLCRSINSRYKQYILDKRLILHNFAITNEEKEVDFYINSWSSWSSLFKSSKAVSENEYKTLKVQGKTLDSVLKGVNNIYYIKIDIEGGELSAIESIKNWSRMPPYISFEMDSSWPKILEILVDLGYKAFQLIRQGKDYLKPLDSSKEGSTININFTNHHSGAFGKDLTNPWMSKEEVSVHYGGTPDFLGVKKQGEGWYDIHAKHKDV